MTFIVLLANAIIRLVCLPFQLIAVLAIGGWVIILLLLYLVALPFIVLHWLITHPVGFNVIRVLLAVGGGIVFLPIANNASSVSVMFAASMAFGACVAPLLHKGSYKVVTSMHRPFSHPFGVVSRLLDNAWRILSYAPKHITYQARPPKPPRQLSMPPEQEHEEIYIAESAPTLAQSADELPDHLKDLLTDPQGDPHR